MNFKEVARLDLIMGGAACFGQKSHLYFFNTQEFGDAGVPISNNLLRPPPARRRLYASESSY